MGRKRKIAEPKTEDPEKEENSVKEVVEEIVEDSKEIVEDSKEVAKEVVEDSKEIVKDGLKDSKEVAEEIVEEVSKEVAEEAKVVEVKVPKKRGRKKKVVTEEEKLEKEKKKKEKESSEKDGEPKPQRRRGRRKKYAIDSIKKLREDGVEDKVSFKSNNEHLEDLEQTQVSFGSLNITVYNSKPVDKKDLRKMFDENFELEEDEKAPTVLLQEKGSKVSISQENLVQKDIIKVSSSFKNDGLEIKKKDSKNGRKNNSNNGNNINNGINQNEPLSINPLGMMRYGKNVAKKKIHKVLRQFQKGERLDSEDWPEKTDVYCWHCCHPFDTVPIPCPINYDEVRNRFDVKGIFCSWPCVSAYSNENYQSLSHVFLFKRKLGDMNPIKIAPEKIVLKNFGGFMSIEDFRNYGKSENSENLENSEKGKKIKKDHHIKISTEHISYINQEILETYVESKC